MNVKKNIYNKTILKHAQRKEEIINQRTKYPQKKETCVKAQTNREKREETAREMEDQAGRKRKCWRGREKGGREG